MSGANGLFEVIEKNKKSVLLVFSVLSAFSVVKFFFSSYHAECGNEVNFTDQGNDNSQFYSLIFRLKECRDDDLSLRLTTTKGTEALRATLRKNQEKHSLGFLGVLGVLCG